MRLQQDNLFFVLKYISQINKGNFQFCWTQMKYLIVFICYIPFSFGWTLLCAGYDSNFTVGNLHHFDENGNTLTLPFSVSDIIEFPRALSLSPVTGNLFIGSFNYKYISSSPGTVYEFTREGALITNFTCLGTDFSGIGNSASPSTNCKLFTQLLKKFTCTERSFSLTLRIPPLSFMSFSQTARMLGAFLALLYAYVVGKFKI